MEDENEIDERPPNQSYIMRQPSQTRSRINNTTDNSVTRANNLNSRVFDGASSSHAFSPMSTMYLTNAQNKNISIKNSSVHTPMQNLRYIN